MVIERGCIGWAGLGPTVGSRSAKRRPVLVVRADSYNSSRLATVLVAVITSNTALGAMPGNVFIPAAAAGLPRDSVVNVTAIVTRNKTDLDAPLSRVPDAVVLQVDRGLRRVLGL